MKFILSEHAITKVKKRKIPLSLIEDVYQNPQQIINQDNLSIFQSIVLLNERISFKDFR